MEARDARRSRQPPPAGDSDPPARRVALLATSNANVLEKLDELITLVEAQPSDLELGWSFDATLYFVHNDESVAAVRRPPRSSRRPRTLIWRTTTSKRSKFHDRVDERARTSSTERIERTTGSELAAGLDRVVRRARSASSDLIGSIRWIGALQVN